MPRKARKLDVSCPNAACRNHGKLGLRNIIRFGKQANKTQRYRCTDCNRTFARTIGTPFFRKHLSKKEITRMCRLLSEKTGFRAIARATEHHLDTVRAVADVVAKHCKKFNEYFITELKLTPVEVDEMWSFIKKRKKIASRPTSAALR